MRRRVGPPFVVGLCGSLAAMFGLVPAIAFARSLMPDACRNHYSLLPAGEVFKLEIAQRTALVDGRAPRCLVASSVAAAVVNDQAHFFSSAPRDYFVHGARWTGA